MNKPLFTDNQIKNNIEYLSTIIESVTSFRERQRRILPQLKQLVEKGEKAEVLTTDMLRKGSRYRKLFKQNNNDYDTMYNAEKDYKLSALAVDNLIDEINAIDGVYRETISQ